MFFSIVDCRRRVRLGEIILSVAWVGLDPNILSSVGSGFKKTHVQLCINGLWSSMTLRPVEGQGLGSTMTFRWKVKEWVRPWPWGRRSRTGFDLVARSAGGQASNVGLHHLEVGVQLAGVEEDHGGQHEAHYGASHCSDGHRLRTLVRLAPEVRVNRLQRCTAHWQIQIQIV